MVYCINAELAFQTRAANDSVFAALLASITSQLRFGAEQFEKQNSKFGPWGTFIIMRFRQRSDAVALKDLIDAQTLINPPLTGSFYRIHDCLHDEESNCSIGNVTVF